MKQVDPLELFQQKLMQQKNSKESFEFDKRENLRKQTEIATQLKSTQRDSPERKKLIRRKSALIREVREWSRNGRNQYEKNFRASVTEDFMNLIFDRIEFTSGCKISRKQSLKKMVEDLLPEYGSYANLKKKRMEFKRGSI